MEGGTCAVQGGRGEVGRRYDRRVGDGRRAARGGSPTLLGPPR